MRHEAVYKTTESSLPLLDLVALLAEQRQTGSIHTVLSSLLLKKNLNGPYLAQILLEQGNVCACSITSRETGFIVLKEQDAFEYLCHLEGITWQLTLGEREIPGELSPRRPIQEPPSYHSQPFSKRIPRRVKIPTPQELHMLSSRKHRHVLSLVDGQRTTEEIGRLLSLGASDTENILNEFVSFGLITFN